MPFEQQSASGRLVRGSTVSLSRVYPFCLFTVGSFLSVNCRVLLMELETILQHRIRFLPHTRPLSPTELAPPNTLHTDRPYISSSTWAHV